MTRTCCATFIARLAALLLLLSIGLAPRAFSVAQDEPPLTGTILLTVTDDAGEPLSKAIVVLFPSERERKTIRKNGGIGGLGNVRFTDADGVVILSIPPGEARVLIVSRPDKSAWQEVSIQAMNPDEDREIDVVIGTMDDALFVGRVVGPDGAPVVGAGVAGAVLRGLTSSARPEVMRASSRPGAKTDADGRFEFAAATWRTSTLTIYAEGFVPRRVTIGGKAGNVNTEAPVSISLSPASSIAVTIRGLEGAIEVFADGDEGRLFAAGLAPGFTAGSKSVRFIARMAPGGPHILSELPADTIVRLSVAINRETVFEFGTFTTPVSGETAELEWDLTLDHSISGVLVEEDGRPIAGETIWIRGDGARTSRQFTTSDQPLAVRTTDADGRFTFEEMVAAVYRVGVAPGEGLDSGADEGAGGQPALLARVLLADAAGGDDAVSVRIIAVRGLFIRGRLIGADGDPVMGDVSAHNKVTGHSVRARRITSNGEFELGPLLRVDYSISGRTTASDHEVAAEVVTRPAGTDDVVIRFRRAGGVMESSVVFPSPVQSGL